MFHDLRYELIGTPLERPVKRLRAVFRSLRKLRHPELNEIYLEDERVDAVFARVLTPDANCLDIGCHFGSVLSELIRLAPNGTHVAFEAIPEKVNFLRRKFPGVLVHAMALSDTAGVSTFFVNEKRTGYSGLARHGGGTFREISVRCRRLDEMADDLPRIAFIKIDVEGAELFVLRGAKKLLERDRPTILFECSPSGPPAFGYGPGDLFDLLTECDYDIYLPKDFLDGGAPIERSRFEAALVYPFQAFNWVAKPAVRTRAETRNVC
jgi:FkbM family methyltransferase